MLKLARKALAGRALAASVFLTAILSSLGSGPLTARQIAASPLGKIVVIVLDDSGSMKKAMGRDSRSRMKVAKQAMQRLVDALPDDTQLGIVLLNGAKDKDGWILPLGKFDRVQARDTVAEIRADGGTPLGSVMQRAMDELLQLRDKQPYGDYRLVVITDGEATDAPVLKANLPKLVSKGVMLDVIGVDMQSDHSLVQRSHSYRRANDAASFEQALKEIFAESSFDANAGDQGFELIAALPDGLAEQALVALRESGRDSANNESASSEDVDSSNTGSVAYPSAPPTPTFTNNSRQAPEKGSSISGKLFFAVLVLFIIVLFRGLTKNMRRK